jgi:octaprenyl-diphosphate synthase
MISPSERQSIARDDLSTGIDEVFDEVREDLAGVELCLIDSLRSDVRLIASVGEYIFQSGGKRLRPLLAILSSRLCGYRGKAHVIMAAIVELIHTATLLHDDVVDHADLRRGARSVNNLWNNETSVLMGDFLFTRAFCMMAEHRDMRVIDLLARTCRQLAEGEILELTQHAEPDIEEQEYLAVVRNKTAVLISAAAQLGAILGDKPLYETSLSHFGAHLGMAFQLVDDVLDYAADEVELGKTIGKDLQEGKVTLPMIRTLAVCSENDRRRFAEVIRTRSQAASDLQRVLDIIKEHDGLEYTHTVARHYVEEAKEALSTFPDDRNKAAMFTLADFVADRKK